jgi:hypothetical protein
VGVGIGGVRSILARASAVDGAGEILYDKYVRPIEKVTGTPLLLCCTPPTRHPLTPAVTDYRTHVSGITAKLVSSPDAVSFKEVSALVGVSARLRLIDRM